MISIYSFVLCIVLVIVSSEKSEFNLAKNSLNNARDKLNVINNSNIILVVGKLSSAKFTLVHYVAGDLSKLTAIHQSTNNLIQSTNGNNTNVKNKEELDPENGSITWSTVLQTYVPETVIDDQQNMWYDCPGFAEISNETAEIANKVLIKSVIENASNVKIVLVVDYESVKNSQNHSEFDQLLNNMTQLIKSVQKFENSLSLVVTIAPATYADEDLSEENVKKTTAEFMSNHTSSLPQNDEKVLLINALLKKSEKETYQKISVFWQPDKFNLWLNEIEKFEKARALIRKSILEYTAYEQIQLNDFNFSISEDAILHINYMKNEAVKSFNSQVQNISDRLLNEVNQMIQSQHDFDKMLTTIHIGQSKIEDYNKIDAFNVTNLTELFRELIKEIGLQSIKENALTQIEREENYLNVMESIIANYNFRVMSSENRINCKSLLNKISVSFKKCETDINFEIPRIIMNNISVALINVDQKLVATLQEKLEEMNGIYNKLNILQTGKKSIKFIGNAKTLGQRIKQFITLIRNLNVTSIDISACNQIEQDSLYLNKLVSRLNSQTVEIPVETWIANSSSAIEFLASEYLWYSFLSDVYNFLASYEVQKDVGAYNARDLSNSVESKKLQDLVITGANFKNFTQHFNNLTDFVPTPSKLNEFNQIINATLKSSLKYHCDNQIVLIEGNFVKSSNIQLDKCPNTSKREIRKINVFVADTFYVDNDLNLNGNENLELHILANKWNILNRTTFRLNGIDGASQEPPTSNGTAGKAGNRGTNSGNFFGVANEIINGNALTIELIGGNGGNGQDGSGNEDIHISYKTINYTDYYYPEHIPINILKTFQSDLIKKVFTKANSTCSYVKHETSSLFLKNVTYTETAFPDHCCGATGTGGAGGLGGVSGYSAFIHIANTHSELPRFERKNGADGKPGQNATLCKTNALEAHNVRGIFNKCTCTEPMHSVYETGWNEMYAYHYSKDIDFNDKCPDKYVTNTDVVSTPPIQFPLLMSVTITEYKRFLLEKQKNPILVKIAQDIYDAIESNYNFDNLV